MNSMNIRSSISHTMGMATNTISKNISIADSPCVGLLLTPPGLVPFR